MVRGEAGRHQAVVPHLRPRGTLLLPICFCTRELTNLVLVQDWTFGEDGLMKKRQMSGNDVRITNEQRWFKEDVADVNTVEIPEHEFI